jgi:hypothetical protein
MTAFKSKQHLSNIRTVNRGIKINCNLGAIMTNQDGAYGSMNVWFIPETIADIFLLNELESKYCITYNSWQGYYIVHTAQGEVIFY